MLHFVCPKECLHRCAYTGADTKHGQANIRLAETVLLWSDEPQRRMVTANPDHFGVYVE